MIGAMEPRGQGAPPSALPVQLGQAGTGELERSRQVVPGVDIRAHSSPRDF